MERIHDTPGEPPGLAEHLERLNQSLEQGRAELAGLHEHLNAVRSQLRSARAHASDLAWELEDLEHHLYDLRRRREGPGDLLLERELASMTQRHAVLEEQALAQMLHVDELVARYAVEEQALTEQERAWAAREATLLTEHQRITDLLQ
jgi:chromosome segregation ATPase